MVATLLRSATEGLLRSAGEANELFQIVFSHISSGIGHVPLQFTELQRPLVFETLVNSQHFSLR